MCLRDEGVRWPLYVVCLAYALNTFVPAVDRAFLLYETVFVRKLPYIKTITSSQIEKSCHILHRIPMIIAREILIHGWNDDGL